MKHETYSQCSRILATLKNGEAITSYDALQRFQCFRLSGRIHDLVHGTYDGIRYDIQTVMVKRGGKRVAQYRLMTPRLRIIEEIEPYKQPVETKPSNTLF